MNGPDSGLIPVDVGGEKWLLGSVCERGNCGDHYLKILYIPSEHVIAGFYYNSGEENMFGDVGGRSTNITPRCTGRYASAAGSGNANNTCGQLTG